MQRATAHYRAELKQAEKNRVKLPREMVAQMKTDIEAAEANVVSAAISLGAVSKYPPIVVLR